MALRLLASRILEWSSSSTFLGRNSLTKTKPALSSSISVEVVVFWWVAASDNVTAWRRAAIPIFSAATTIAFDAIDSASLCWDFLKSMESLLLYTWGSGFREDE
ncbi:hypothetical protein SESBI_29819 [Sesbania bispinosa]|nr:hypothetical protein SESBI_29819 [Sesbania bispinosa]